LPRRSSTARSNDSAAQGAAENNELCITGGKCWGPGASTTKEESEERWKAFFKSDDGKAALAIYGGDEALIQTCVTTSGNAQCASTEANYKTNEIAKLSGDNLEIKAALEGLSAWQIETQVEIGSLTPETAAERQAVAAALGRMPEYMKAQFEANLADMSADDVNALTKLGATLFGDNLSAEDQLQYGLLSIGLQASVNGAAEGAGAVLSPIGQLLVDLYITSPEVSTILTGIPETDKLLDAANVRQQNRIAALQNALEGAGTIVADFIPVSRYDPITGKPRALTEEQEVAEAARQKRAAGHIAELIKAVKQLPEGMSEQAAPLVNCLMGTISPNQCGQAITSSGIGVAVTIGTDGLAKIVLSKIESVTAIRAANNAAAIMDANAAGFGIQARVVSSSDLGLVWGRGQNYAATAGTPFENYVGEHVAGVGQDLNYIVTNSNTFDFFNDASGLATSAKTLDTGAASYQNPSAIVSKINIYIEEVANYSGVGKNSVVDPSLIQSKAIQLAVPVGTTTSQWVAIQQSIENAASKGIQMSVTVVK
jgi:hypothetical protein